MAEEFGPYLLEEVLGRGGMGVVYRAFDTHRDRVVALKRLPRHLAEDETFQARFRRESRMAARLNEPHIIPIHDFGEIEGQLFIDMRLVEGHDLSTLITSGLTPEIAVDLIGQVASALGAAHSAGLVHRDVKPSNVIVTGMSPDNPDSAFAYLVDFGIARAMPGTGGTALTSSTGTVGTLGYMAPERISGTSGDSRSDIYSLACMLYECLVGHTPFGGEPFQMMFAHVNSDPPTVTAVRPDVPAELDAVIRRGMAKRPDDRYQSTTQFAAAARRALTAGAGSRPAPAPSASPVGPPHAPPTPDLARTPAPWTPQPYPTSPHTPPPRPQTPTPMPSGPLYGAVEHGAQSAPYTGPPAAARAPVFDGGPSTPLPPRRDVPGPPAPSGRRRARLLIAGIVAVVLVAGGVIAAIALSGGSSTPHAGGTGNPSLSAPPTSTPAASTGLTAQWQPYADFTDLVGVRSDDTTTAFRGASCEVVPATTGVTGMQDQIACAGLTHDSPVQYYVARFDTAAHVQDYLDTLTAAHYDVTHWTLEGQNRGLLYTSPDGASRVEVTSSICGLPTYLVQFTAVDAGSLTAAQVENRYWKAAHFPNSVPAACSG